LYLLSISFLSYSTGNDIMSTLYFLLQKVFLYPLLIDSRYTGPFRYNDRHQLFEHIFHYIVYYNIIVIFVLPNLHDSVLKPYSNNFIRIAHPFHKSLSEHLHRGRQYKYTHASAWGGRKVPFYLASTLHIDIQNRIHSGVSQLFYP